jgi:hypothetical protein
VTRDPARLAKRLTSAQARALAEAVRFPWSSDPIVRQKLYPRLSVRMDVRHRLQLFRLLSLRPGHGLTKLGEQVREALLARS